MPMDTVKKLSDAENAAFEAENAARKAADEAVKAAKLEAEKIIEAAKQNAATIIKDAESRAAEAAGKLKSEFEQRLRKETEKLNSDAKSAKNKVVKIIMDELV